MGLSMMVLVAMVGILSGWVQCPSLDGGDRVVVCDWDWLLLVDVLGEPAEALAVALPLQHTAHEHLQWSCVQLLHRNGALREKQEKALS